ncbi:MAG: DUF4091 domain-containing protein [Clostridia bacterium]|nr:DUF4091 domain-containing protein [Clostridia bacterium]
MLRAKIISSLEKCFLDETVPSKKALGAISMLKNERYSFQVCYDRSERVDAKVIVHLNVESPLADCLKITKVQQIPSAMPVYQNRIDDNYLCTKPGLFPDLLDPIRENDRLVTDNNLHALWIEVVPDGKVDAGVYPIKLSFVSEGGAVEAAVETEVEIINAELPKQEMLLTQWFYTDCLMQYYNVEAWSEKHWEIIENFMVSAKEYGQNMILTPLLTPELDTYVGGYRPTTQLVGIVKEGDKYTFDFSNVGRWVDLCDKVGIEAFEICHFYSQWGAKACPKVVATVDGEEKRIFGWDTEAAGDDYKNFLTQLIPAFIQYMKEEKNGADKRCWFHLSDEPNEKHLEQYKLLSEFLLPLIKGYPMIDALSKYAFYEQGLVDHPVPGTNHIEPFLEHNVPELWTYYCCSQCVDVSNRFFSMPSARNRILGLQLYKYNIYGFLQWGFNFYNNQYSYATINPYVCTDGEGFVPSGDNFVVYPGENGKPLSSLRQVVFNEGLQDMRALKLLESLYGREKAMEVLEEGIEPITFKSYPHEDEFILNLRRRINALIKAKV